MPANKAPLSPNDVLRGKRIQLRPPRWEEMQFVRWLWGDPETMKPVGGPINLTEDEARDWFVGMVDPGRQTDCYCLIFNEENRAVGEISFHRLDPQGVVADFNLKIASTKRRKGYAREAMLLFLDYFFNCFGGYILTDDIALDNQAGQHVLLRFGFEHDPSVEGVFRLRMTQERYNTLYGPDKPTGDSS